MIADKRVNMTETLIDGIKLIKLYAWEIPYLKLIFNERDKEIKALKKFLNAFGIINVAGYAGIGLLLLISLVFIINFGEELSSSDLYLLIALCIFFHSYTVYMSLGSIPILSLVTICKRIEEILLLREYSYPDALESDKKAIVVENASFSWKSKPEDKKKDENEKDENEATGLITEDVYNLSGISFELNKGELLMVIGPTGSGKSTVLLGLLGELNLISGQLKVNGKISYLSSDPWLIPGTIKENILMGKDYNEDLYKQVLETSALAADIELMNLKDETIVGDRGITLSGGQKARVALARALYSQYDIYFLDDPLSAVDVQVANHIFKNAIKGQLKGKTVVLVTHQSQFLNEADKILVLDSGTSVFYGTPAEFSKVDYIKSTIEQGQFKEKPAKKQEDADYDKKIENLLLSNADKNESKVTFTTYYRFIIYGFRSIIVYLLVVFTMALSQLSYLSVLYWSSY